MSRGTKSEGDETPPSVLLALSSICGDDHVSVTSSSMASSCTRYVVPLGLLLLLLLLPLVPGSGGSGGTVMLNGVGTATLACSTRRSLGLWRSDDGATIDTTGSAPVGLLSVGIATSTSVVALALCASPSATTTLSAYEPPGASSPAGTSSTHPSGCAAASSPSTSPPASSPSAAAVASAAACAAALSPTA